MGRSAATHDRYGLPLSTASTTAAERYVEGVDRLISRNAGGIKLLREAAEADEGFALALAALAIAYRLAGRMPEARASAERAVALAPGISRREARHVQFADRYVQGDDRSAVRLLREQLDEFPSDALLLSQHQFVDQSEGRADRREQTVALVERLAPAYGDDWWFASFAAMAYQEVDQFERARRLAVRSLDQQPRNANAAHPLAHVYYETDDHAAGASFLDGWMAAYDRAAPFYSHLAWHLALSELASGQYERVIALYDAAISPAVARTRVSFFDAASLLWRLEIYGCMSGADTAWRAVCDLGAHLFPSPSAAFADAMMALACAGAGDDAVIGRLVDGLRAQAAGGHPTAGTVVLPLLEGVVAFARGEYQTAARTIEGVAGDVVRIGGSNAQREVFEDTLLEAYLRAGQFDRAEALLRRRLDRRSSTRDFYWLGRAQAGSGAAAADAEQSLQAAQERWVAAGADTPELVALDQSLGTAIGSRMGG